MSFYKKSPAEAVVENPHRVPQIKRMGLSGNGTETRLVFSHRLTKDGEETETARREALGLAAWLEVFWLPTQERKYPTYLLTVNCTTIYVFIKKEQDPAVPSPGWNKMLKTVLKKIQVEDLGDLAARDLYATIPVEDKEGRGRKDLEKLEKHLSVKVAFLKDSHVLLVGAKSKLEKKCLVIRNVLSHYYWRLKGKQINL